MTRIILIGYMGAGKTTVGKALSQSLALQIGSASCRERV